MVGSLLILKLLQCKRHHSYKHSKSHRNNFSSRKNSTESSDQEIISSRIKSEVTDGSCRVCLKDGDVPIFDDDDASDELCKMINEFGAIQVRGDDPFPKYLCKYCHNLLEGAVLFRKIAQESNEKLKQQVINDTASNTAPFGGDDVEFNSDSDDLPLKNPGFNCQRCDMQFKSLQEYHDHITSGEHETKRITCQLCNKSYLAKYFRQHEDFHKKPGVCDICGKKFTQSQLKRHRVTHFNDNLPVACELCPYRGRFPESLKMHMRSHTGEKPYQCPQCPSRFISKSNLNKHMLTHRGQHDFRCEVCGRGYYTKRELDLHTKVDHMGIKEHICETCGKAFGYRKQMRKHEIKVHHRKKLKAGNRAIWSKLETLKQNTEATLES